MRLWKRYQEWLAELEQLGYRSREQLLNAADFGVPQSRKRLFIVCDLERMPPEVLPSPGRKIRPAKTIISYNGAFPFSRLDSKRRAKPTLERAKRAMANLGNHKPFLIVYYGSDGAGGWQRLNVPLRTVTTFDRFAYVRPNGDGYEMLKPGEVEADAHHKYNRPDLMIYMFIHPRQVHSITVREAARLQSSSFWLN